MSWKQKPCTTAYDDDDDNDDDDDYELTICADQFNAEVCRELSNVTLLMWSLSCYEDDDDDDEYNDYHYHDDDDYHDHVP